jgi:hypothetical protein
MPTLGTFSVPVHHLTVHFDGNNNLPLFRVSFVPTMVSTHSRGLLGLRYFFSKIY